MERERDVQKGEVEEKPVVLAARKKKKNEGERESLFNKLKE